MAFLAPLSACNLTAGPRGLDATSTLVPPAPATQARELPAFQSLYVEGALDVELRVGSPCAVRFVGDEDRLAELTAEVRDGTLLLAAEPATTWRDGPRAVVSLPALASLTSAGSGWVSVTGLDEARLAVTLRGSGDVLLRGRVGELVAEDRGAGRLDASGITPR
ncbi:MAG: DUF2807 domain-containing protein [Planctomycetota bacterium]|nr:DUF2807 domain-containing protein [Planctomycetota bacterium]